jgi:antitoxin component YwqK of YwqJK toxin-antitoxin module
MSFDDHCYICYEEETTELPFARDPLPCACRGSIHIHTECLQTVISPNDLTKSQIRCRTCRVKYHDAYVQTDDGYHLDEDDEYRIKFKTNSEGKYHGTLYRYDKAIHEMTSITYVDGQRHGPKVSTWVSTGTQRLRCMYAFDKKEGDLDAWYPSGQRQVHCTFREDELDGEYSAWHENGALHVYYNSIRGETNGLYQMWDANRNLIVKSYFVGGKKYGDEIHYFSNGNMRSKTPFTNNVIQGLASVWYENGTLWREDHFQDNKLHGISKTWGENGTLLEEKQYDDGVLIRTIIDITITTT